VRGRTTVLRSARPLAPASGNECQSCKLRARAFGTVGDSGVRRLRETSLLGQQPWRFRHLGNCRDFKRRSSICTRSHISNGINLTMGFFYGLRRFRSSCKPMTFRHREPASEQHAGWAAQSLSEGLARFRKRVGGRFFTSGGAA